MRPIIGITSTYPIRDICSNDYTRAIKAFDGEPRPLYPGISETAYTDIDGLLLTGGPDIDPKCYNEKKHPKTQCPCRARDTQELLLFKNALAADIPVFGICRGIQIMNVAVGGSLYQDIDSQLTAPLCHPKKDSDKDSKHKIEIGANSLLSTLISKDRDIVNSAHHQAVKGIGDGFTVTARSEDGIIEAIERDSHRFVVGVQYHPERMLQDPELRQHGQKLFEAFIQAASQ